MLTRRRLLAAGAVLATGGYINARGLRYPRMGFEPDELSTSFHAQSWKIGWHDAILRPPALQEPTPGSTQLQLRAIAPEPQLSIQTENAQTFHIKVLNIAPSALLKTQPGAAISVEEQRDGCQRSLTISLPRHANLDLQWFIPATESCRFAVIGDTGGGAELRWALERARQLDALFLLHLGDFNYGEGEYPEAIAAFDSAPLPCYISIGNHDFNDSGLVYQHFLTQLGPFNHAFEIAGTQFINVDTAADFFPAWSGLRGEMLDNLSAGNTRIADRVCFTHRNFLDPRAGREHVIGRSGERRWLASALREAGLSSLLTGHVHRTAELEYRGLKQYTVGEGLGFEDIVHQRQVAEMLLGAAQFGTKVQYQRVPLNMPWSLHSSPEHAKKLRKEHTASSLHWYEQQLAEASKGLV